MTDVCTRGVDTGFVALGYGKVAVLGVLQGITELLPISSTAHMRLVPALLGWQDPGSAFSASMQIAALAAVVSYFWKDVKGLILGSVNAAAHGDFSRSASPVFNVDRSSYDADRHRRAVTVKAPERLQFAHARPFGHWLGLHGNGFAACRCRALCPP